MLDAARTNDATIDDLEDTLPYFFGGAFVGLIFLSIFSDCFIKQEMLFLPVLIANVLQLIIFIIGLVVVIAMPDLDG